VIASRRAMLAVIAALAFEGRAFAQAIEVTESTVKAAFLYKFAGYIDWPDGALEAGDAFVIGVMGNDEVYAELERILPGRRLGERALAVRRVKDLDSLKGVQLLFVGRAESARLPAFARAAQRQGVLVVSETERGLDAGSVINFVVSDNRVGFEVSLDAAERSGHRVSSRMLAVARRVVPKAG
jgi:ABC-type sugar transport system substrate-binding protein